jgi:chemotaxis protein MotB
VQVGAARDGVIISLSGNVLFDSGRADLKPAGLAMLNILADRVRDMPNDLRIEGHTDDIPIETSIFPSNWELSAARAVSVARYLSDHGRIKPERLTAAGYGQFRPAAPNTTREGRARNRRVDIVIVFGSMPAASGVGVPLQPEGVP